MTNQSSTDYQNQISAIHEKITTLQFAKSLLPGCSANTRDVEVHIRNMNSTIDDLFYTIKLLQAQEIIEEIQEMCKKINIHYPIHHSVDGCFIQDFKLGKFREILKKCKSRRQELLVLYCYVIAFACKFAKHPVWNEINSKKQKNPDDNSIEKDRNSLYINTHEMESKLPKSDLPLRAILMAQKVMIAYYIELISTNENNDEVLFEVPISGDFLKTINKDNYQIDQIDEFFIEFRESLRCSNSKTKTTQLVIFCHDFYTNHGDILLGKIPDAIINNDITDEFLLHYV